jgi:hypothetical protein
LPITLSSDLDHWQQSISGGTPGVGEPTIRTLARNHGKGGKWLLMYIVGQDKTTTATSVISDCLNLCAAGDFHFVQAGDLSLLSDVDPVSAEIIKREEIATRAEEKPRINFLLMCHAYLRLKRDEVRRLRSPAVSHKPPRILLI